MTTHELKTWPDFAEAIADGRKTFEVRRTHDRTFAVGDVLHLRVWDPATERYTGLTLHRRVVYVVEGPPFLPEGLAVLGIEKVGGVS